jgi:hypothetical protein
MVIRSDQMETMEDVSRRRFDEMAAAYLRKHHAEEPVTKDEPELRGFIKQGVDKAATFRITREVDVIRFLEVLLITGMEFETSTESSWVAEYLREDIRAEARLDNVIKRLHFDTPGVR